MGHSELLIGHVFRNVPQGHGSCSVLHKIFLYTPILARNKRSLGSTFLANKRQIFWPEWPMRSQARDLKLGPNNRLLFIKCACRGKIFLYYFQIGLFVPTLLFSSWISFLGTQGWWREISVQWIHRDYSGLFRFRDKERQFSIRQ